MSWTTDTEADKLKRESERLDNHIHRKDNVNPVIQTWDPVWHVTLGELPTDKGAAAELFVDGKSVWKSADDGKDASAKVDVNGGDRYHEATFLLKIPVMGFENSRKLKIGEGNFVRYVAGDTGLQFGQQTKAF